MVCAGRLWRIGQQRVVLRVLYAAVGISSVVDTFLAVAFQRLQIIVFIVGVLLIVLV